MDGALWIRILSNLLHVNWPVPYRLVFVWSVSLPCIIARMNMHHPVSFAKCLVVSSCSALHPFGCQDRIMPHIADMLNDVPSSEQSLDHLAHEIQGMCGVPTARAYSGQARGTGGSRSLGFFSASNFQQLVSRGRRCSESPLRVRAKQGVGEALHLPSEQRPKPLLAI